MAAPTDLQFPQTLGEDALASISATLASEKDVVAAYVFGSRATDRYAPRSDLDIAVLFAGNPDVHALATRRLELIAALESLSPWPVDVVVLNHASPVLQMEVLRARRRLCERDRAARLAFETHVFAVYADEQPHRDFIARMMLEEIHQGRFGGRGRRNRSLPSVRISYRR